MEVLIEAQVELYGRIARTHDNLRKSGFNKIIKALIFTILRLLDTKKFEKNHERLLDTYRDEVKKHNYHLKDFLGQAEEIYVQQRAVLLEMEEIVARDKARETAKPKRTSSRQLNTVTYGLASYLAIHQLAQDEGRQFPRGSETLRMDVYVDNILTGALHGGFPLKKWAKDEKLLSAIPEEEAAQPDNTRCVQAVILDFLRTSGGQGAHPSVRCMRWREATPQEVMGDLPESRVTPSRPFQHSRVDYARPVLLRTSRSRGHNAHKTYIAVFVCLSTRAVHLEVISTTESRIDQLCILRNEVTQPLRWLLVRIIALHSGQDGRVRVVTVRTAYSEFKRPLIKIIFFPNEDLLKPLMDSPVL
ncbi:hypothetical protein ALC56_02419 [Trachymyrmex septentrionalis]|uniref:DUF5641 domain-containing protein n=1 Tax=Trachymyrmex septentrionalis TaxID=34720 RepID=A0A195FTL6_9HYME|nr:hypothetical protein ALC56_02419 [Trachymyrmex septentrionalis]